MMSLTREDMLRELELLPVWRMRMPPVLDIAIAPASQEVPLPEVDEMVEAAAVADKIVSPDVVTDPAMAPSAPEVVTLHAPAAASEAVPASTLNGQPAVEDDAPNDAFDAAVDDQPAMTPIVSLPPLIQSPWLIYSTRPSDAASQQLLQNIMQAMQLPADEVTVHHELLQRAQVSSRYGVLFGLEAANQFLNTKHTDISAVRGQLHAVGDLWCVMTHDLAAMLQTPSLKREVWQDLCLLLAKKSEVIA